MADGHHSKIVKCDISATVWPILIEFRNAMHISHSNLTCDKCSKIYKSKIADGGHLKIEKNVISRMSDFDKILHGGVDLVSRRNAMHIAQLN